MYFSEQAMLNSVYVIVLFRNALHSFICCSVPESCLTLCNPMNYRMVGFPVLQYLLEFAQIYVHWVCDAICLILCCPLIFCLQSVPASWSFHCVGFSHQVAKVLELLQLQHQSFQWVHRVDFLKDWLVWSPYCSRDSQESSLQHHNLKTSVLQGSALCMDQLSHPYMTTGKTIALTDGPLSAKWYLYFLICCLGLLSLSFLILEPRKIKSVIISTFPRSICHEVMGLSLDAMVLVFWMLSFKPTYSLSTLTLIKNFSSSSVSVIVRLLIFLPTVLILTCFIQSGISHDVLCIEVK